MSIRLLVGGKAFDGWLDAEVSTSMDSIAGQFNVSVALSDATNLPILLRQEIQIFVDNDQVIDGFIESINGIYTNGSDEVSFSGRDKTADIIDSQIGGTPDIRGPISFAGLINEILEFVNIKDIGVVNNVPDIKKFTQADIVAPSMGQNVFELLNDYAAKRQVFLITDGFGNIVINRDTNQKIATPITHRVTVGSPNLENNVISATWQYDDTARFNKYQTFSQDNVSASSLAALASVTDGDIKQIVSKKGQALDKEIRDTRVKIIQSEKPMSNDECKLRATWELDIARARSVTYSAVIDRHSHRDGIWRPNRLVTINDDRAVIGGIGGGDFLINAVIYSTSLLRGDTTNIQIVERSRYKLIVEESKFNKQVAEQGEKKVVATT